MTKIEQLKNQIIQYENCDGANEWKKAEPLKKEVVRLEMLQEQAMDLLRLIKDKGKESHAEIDARFWCFLESYEFKELDGYAFVFHNGQDLVASTAPKFSTSRDILKRKRPDGWAFSMGYGGEYECRKEAGKSLLAPAGVDTEELSEMFVIVQAYMIERF